MELQPLLMSPAFILTRNVTVLIALVAFVGLVWVVPVWLIMRKLGYSRPITLLILLGLYVPVINIVVLWIAAIAAPSRNPDESSRPVLVSGDGVASTG